MNPATRTISATALLFASLTFAPAAFAFGIFTVGPAVDCPYHSIQDAVDAAAANPGVDYVWISNDLASGTKYSYSGQHIHVHDADGVIIEGGFVSCSDYDIGPGENTTISGAGNDGLRREAFANFARRRSSDSAPAWLYLSASSLVQ